MAGLPAGYESDCSDEDEIYFTSSDFKKEKQRTEDKYEDTQLHERNGRNYDSSSSVQTFTNEFSVQQLPSRSIHELVGSPVDDLRVAVMQGNINVVQDLINKGMSADTILKAGWTPLMYACSSGDSEIVQFLLENGADSNYHKDMFTPLMAACASRRNQEENLLKCVKLLIENNAKSDVCERHLMSPLMFAAREGRYEVVKFLIQHGLDINRQDNRGWTALAWAAHSGHGKIVRLLLESKADPTMLSVSGMTPADVASSAGHAEIGNILLKYENEHGKEMSSGEKDALNTLCPSPLRALANGDLSSGSQPPPLSYIRHNDLEVFLSGIQCADLIPLFQQHEITFDDFLLMDEENLEKMGITKVGVKKRILDGIQSVHLAPWQKSSIPSFRSKKFISCPDVVSCMANITFHLGYIKSTVLFLRNKIQHHPRILELGMDVNNVNDLSREINTSLLSTQKLLDELRFFNLHLAKVQNKVEYLPADVIVETVFAEPPEWKRSHRIATIVIGVASAVCGVVYYMRYDNLGNWLSVPRSLKYSW